MRKVLRRAYLRSSKPAALLLNYFWFSTPPAWAITETFSSVWPAVFLCPALKILAWPWVRLNGQLAQRNYGAHYQQSQKTEFNYMLTKSCHEFSPLVVYDLTRSIFCLRTCPAMSWGAHSNNEAHNLNRHSIARRNMMFRRSLSFSLTVISQATSESSTAQPLTSGSSGGVFS